MPNPEQFRAIRFVDERGNKAIASLNPKDYTREQLKQIVEGAINRTLNGEPMRIHIVFLEGCNFLTEEDFGKKMTLEELEHFKTICAYRMVNSQRIFILRQSNPQRLSENPFKQFINTEINVNGI